MRRALLLALLVAGGARAEEEPTPFWMPPPPAKKSAPARRAPPAKKPAPVKKKPQPPAKLLETVPAEPKQGPVEVEAPVRAPVAPAEPPRTPVLAQPAPIPAPAVAAPEQPAAVVTEEPEPEPQVDSGRRWSVDAAFGFWGKSRSDGGGRDWQVAYGLRVGRALLPSLEVEVELLRAGATAGSPFVSASATHNLAALRAFWVLGGDYALLVGGGGGLALAQTHYTLAPANDVLPTGLYANAPKSVMEITAAGRARIFRGLEARAEVSAAVRDGKLEILPLLGAGVAF